AVVPLDVPARRAGGDGSGGYGLRGLGDAGGGRRLLAPRLVEELLVLALADALLLEQDVEHLLDHRGVRARGRRAGACGVLRARGAGRGRGGAGRSKPGWKPSRGGVPMAIQVGEKVPEVTLKTMTADGIKDVTTRELFGGGKRVVLFALPGAFTPTCSAKHLPGFIEKADAIRAKGVDRIVCLSVNDVFVMGAWAKAQNAGDKVVLVADGNAEFSDRK